MVDFLRFYIPAQEITSKVNRDTKWLKESLAQYKKYIDSQFNEFFDLRSPQPDKRCDLEAVDRDLYPGDSRD